MSWPGLTTSEASGGEPAFLSLSDILARGVAIEWYEGIAVVRAVAEQVATSGSGVPELNQVQLRASGTLEIARTGSTDEPVRRLGQLLQALIAQADAPVQLRLLITQATAPTPLFASVKDYADALAYFERPNRTAQLAQLFTRAAAMKPVSDASIPRLDDVAPLPESTPAAPLPTKERKTRASRGWSLGVAALVVVVVTAGAAVWFAKRRGLKAPTGAEMSKVADRASGTLGDAVVSGVSAVTERLGLGRIVPADAPAGEPPAPPPATDPPGKQSTKRRAPATVSARAMPGVAFDLAGTKGGLRGTDTVYDAVVTDGDDDEHLAMNGVMYGPGSAGVTPPVAIEPRLPRELPPDVSEEQLGRIELVIAVDGSVESVKLLGPPRNVKDALFLSVAKAWQFQPALKDGVPVRYRKTIWIAAQ